MRYRALLLLVCATVWAQISVTPTTVAFGTVAAQVRYAGAAVGFLGKVPRLGL